MNQIAHLYKCKVFLIQTRYYATHLKQELNYFMNNGAVTTNNPERLKRLEEKQRYRYKTVQKQVYNKEQARRILRTNYGVDEETSQKMQLGPRSDDDLDILSRTKDKRLIYTILGISGEQLRNSVLIYKDVKKFLMRNQVEKALYLTKLAKTRGAASMNLVTEYYLKNMNSVDAALSLYNWRKKMRIPLDKYTNTILFDGIAKQKRKISKKHGEEIFNIATALVRNGNCNIIEFNSALGALANCEDFMLALKLFESIAQDSSLAHAKYNSTTFMWLWKTCNNVDTKKHFIQLFNGLIRAIPAKTCDSRLMFAISKILLNRSEKTKDDKKLINSAFIALGKYFEDIDFQANNLPCETELILPDISHWKKTSKFPLTIHIANLVMEMFPNMGKYSYGIKFYQKIKNNHITFIDNLTLLNYIKCLINENTSTCAQESLKELIDLKYNYKRDLYNKRIMIEMYQAFKRQSQKTRVHANENNVEQTMDTLDKFIREYDFIIVNGNEKIYAPDSWKFIFDIINQINCENNIQITRFNQLMIQILKNIVNECLFNKNVINSKEGLLADEHISKETVTFIDLFAKKVCELGKFKTELNNLLNKLKFSIIQRSKLLKKNYEKKNYDTTDEYTSLSLKESIIKMNENALNVYKLIKTINM